MKNIFCVSALALSMLLAACGGSNDIAEAEPIHSGDVPLSVLSVFNAKYPGAEDVTWQRQTRAGDVEYEALFIKEGKKKHAEYKIREEVVIEH